MTRTTREREFTDFARARTAALHRSAWMLCRDEHEAQDLVQEALTKVYVMWMRPLTRIDNPVAYAHTTLTRTFLSSRRKRSSTETPLEEFPESPVPDANETTPQRLAMDAALARLAPLDRAIVVARHLDDLSVAETAELVGLSAGAVRIRCMRALEKLRPWVAEPEATADLASFLEPAATTAAPNRSRAEETHV